MASKPRRNNRFVTYGAYTKTVSEWSASLGICRASINYRLKAGWTPGQALGIEPKPPHGNSNRRREL